MRILTVLFALGFTAVALRAEALKINGSTTVNLPVAEAAEDLRAEKEMEIQVDTQGGSSGGISSAGEGRVQIGMISKPLADEDKAKYPDANLTATQIGEDAVAIVVSPDVWESGVHAISKEQAQGIYESRIKNWKELGGEDRRIVFFNKEPGRGTWEVFANWAYGDHKKAPPASFPEVGGNEETRNKVSSTRGAMSQLSSSWADGSQVYALAIKEGDEIIEATPANIAGHKYAMSRPLNLVTRGEPGGQAKVFVDYMLSEPGQKLMVKHGYLSMAMLKADAEPAP